MMLDDGDADTVVQLFALLDFVQATVRDALPQESPTPKTKTPDESLSSDQILVYVFIESILLCWIIVPRAVEHNLER